MGSLKPCCGNGTSPLGFVQMITYTEESVEHNISSLEEGRAESSLLGLEPVDAESLGNQVNRSLK